MAKGRRRGRRGGPLAREARQVRAKARKARRDGRTPSEQRKVLEQRVGALGALKERSRL